MNICAFGPAEFVCHAALNVSTEGFSLLLRQLWLYSIDAAGYKQTIVQRSWCHSSGLDMEEDSAGLIHGLIELSAVASWKKRDILPKAVVTVGDTPESSFNFGSLHLSYFS